MNNLQTHIQNYLQYGHTHKRLDEKTLRAYQIDLKQFSQQITLHDITKINADTLEQYIGLLHSHYKPKTTKRKIATLKAFFHYLEYKEIIKQSPFAKIRIHFRQPVILPKTIPLHVIETILSTAYQHHKYAKTNYQKKNALRDAAVIELLFATGIRISELCSLKNHDINLYDGIILIRGKGDKERQLHIGNHDVLLTLKEYKNEFQIENTNCDYFFITQSGQPLSDQSIRRMINKYCSMASIDMHITPHMFRHTFATSLLEADVDIRYIQEMLGHSSINITEIYTHVTISKKKDILTTRHPRKDFNI